MISTRTNIELDDSTGVRWSKLQLWVRYACDQAGISYTMNGLLSDIQLEDSEGMRFAKLQRWLALLANNISGGGGGGGGTALKTGTTALVAGQQSYAISFSGAGFTAAPAFLSLTLQMPNSSGEVFDASVDLSTLTASGVTVYLSAVPTAASAGGKIAWGGVDPTATSSIKSGSVNLVAGQQSYVIDLTSAGLSAAPSFGGFSVQMPNSSGEVLGVVPDLSTLTSTSVTVWLSAIPTAASSGGKINWGVAA